MRFSNLSAKREEGSSQDFITHNRVPLSPLLQCAESILDPFTKLVLSVFAQNKTMTAFCRRADFFFFVCFFWPREAFIFQRGTLLESHVPPAAP